MIRKGSSVILSLLALVNSKVVGVEINDDFNKKMLKLSENNRFRDAKINSLEVKRFKDLEAVERLKTQEK